MFSNLSEPAANLIYSVGNFLVVIGALAVLVGAVGNVWGDRVRQKYAGLRTSQGQQQIQQAIRDAAASNERSAKANERAAGLEKEAANARLTVETWKNRLNWREITETQTAEFCAATVGVPKAKIEVQYQNNDAEAASFAAQLCEIFLKAGFDAPDRFDKMYGVSPRGGMMIGVNMKVADPQNKTAVGLQLALKKVNVDANGEVASVDPGTIVFDVGQKPPPLSR